MSDLHGRTALVTGAASGIGQAAARSLAEAGAHVVAVDVDEVGLAQTVESNTGGAGTIAPLPADVREPNDVERAVMLVVEKHGRLDIAVNNAGVQGPYLPLTEYSEADFAAVLAVDLIGVWRCMKFELRQMTHQQSGCVVNTSSMLAEVGMANNAAYAAAKHAVHGLTRTAALEVAAAGVRVNAVAPGITRTAMTDAATDDLLPSVPLGRIAEAGEIAAAVLWLASEGSSYVTGSVLVVDGGYLAR